MSSAQMIKDMTDGKPAAAYDQFAAAIQPAVEKHIEDLQAQVREKMFDIEEGKWNYPDNAKGSKGDPYLDPSNSKKKERRKEFRKKVKADAHKKLKAGMKEDTNDE